MCGAACEEEAEEEALGEPLGVEEEIQEVEAVEEAVEAELVVEEEGRPGEPGREGGVVEAMVWKVEVVVEEVESDFVRVVELTSLGPCISSKSAKSDASN